MRGLYAIADVEALEARGLDLEAFVAAVLEARPAALQLRDKRAGARAYLAKLARLAPLCDAAGVPLFANNRPDLAALAGAPGVHVGQDDVPVSVARDVARAIAAGAGMLVGVSTHDREQVRDAIAARPDYVAIGPVFGTVNKHAPEPTVGEARAIELAAEVRAAGLRALAIGGIDAARAARLAAAFDLVAVIGALLPDPGRAEPLADVRARARALVGACATGAVPS